MDARSNMDALNLQVVPVLVQGVFATYAYFVVDAASGHALLVDPGAQADILLNVITRYRWTVERILLTHGHFDHWGAAARLRKELGCPVAIHEQGARYLADPLLNLSARYGAPLTLKPDELLIDGDNISLGHSSVLRVLHTPGHTLDSCVFHCAALDLALVGDTVYEGGPGLTCFPTGDQCQLLASIRRALGDLPLQTTLLSGHSAPLSASQLLASVR